MILNANSIAQHAFQIKNGIMINVNVSVKGVIRQNKTRVGILANVFVNTGQVLVMIQ